MIIKNEINENSFKNQDKSKINFLSQEFKVVEAIKKLFETKKLKIFNLKDFKNVSQLNVKVLPTVKNIINSEDLMYYSEVLNYDLSRLKIIKYIEHSTTNLKLNLQYFNAEFTIDFNFDNNFNDEDYAQVVKNLFQEENFKKIALCEWESKNENWTKIDQLFKSTITENNHVTQINVQKIDLDNSKINFMMLDIDQAQSEQLISIGFEYGQSNVEIITIKLQDFISFNDLKNKINQVLEAGFLINLDQKLNFENFWNNLALDKWKLDIFTFLAKNKLMIRNYELKILQENFQLKDVKDLKFNLILNPWTINFALPFIFKINNFNFDLNVKFKFLSEVNYEKIKQAFISQINNLIIDGQNFKTNEVSQIIQSQVIKHFGQQLKMNSNHYKLDLSQLKVDQVKILIKNNQEIITFNCSNALIYSNPFTIEIKIKNFEKFMLQEIVKYLQKYTEKNPFDVKFKFDVENTWQDLLKMVQNEIRINNFDANIINKITWTHTFNNNLLTKIKDDNFQSYQLFKEVKIIYKGINSDFVIINFKNLVISQDFRDINDIVRTLGREYRSKWDGLYPHWKINDIVSLEDFGITIGPIKKPGITSQFKIQTIDYSKGQITTIMTLKKNNASVNCEIFITNFRTLDSLFNKIQEYFKMTFPYADHKLSTFDPRSKAFEVFKGLLKKLLDYNYRVISNLKFKGSLTDNITNTWKHSGDYFEIEITISGVTKTVAFMLSTVNDGDITKFANDFIKKQLIPVEKSSYPVGKIGRVFPFYEFGLKEPSRQKVEVRYVWKGINTKEGIAIVECSVWKWDYTQKKQIGFKKEFNITIEGFWTNDIMKQKLKSAFENYIDYPQHYLSTRDTRKKAYERCKNLIYRKIGNSFYGITEFKFHGPEETKVINTSTNNGDWFDVDLSFGEVKNFQIRIKLKNVIESDIITLYEKNTKYLRTKKSNFYPLDWKPGYVLTSQELGVDLPSDLLGCTLKFTIDKIILQYGNMDIKLRISKKATFADFPIWISGYKKYQTTASEMIDWLNKKGGRLWGPFNLKKQISRKNNTWNDLLNFIKKEATIDFGNLNNITLMIEYGDNNQQSKVHDLPIGGVFYPPEQDPNNYIRFSIKAKDSKDNKWIKKDGLFFCGNWAD